MNNWYSSTIDTKASSINDIELFRKLHRNNQLLDQLLVESERLNIPDWHIGAGFLAQSTWNILHNKPIYSDINDIDWIYYDVSDLTQEAEESVARMVQSTFQNIPIRLDVKNQARVHLWYESKFGYAINPYQNISHAISTWPTTATAFALSTKNGEISCVAPFGIGDVLNMVVKPNKTQITETIYNRKIQRWAKAWPKLNIFDWNGNPL